MANHATIKDTQFNVGDTVRVFYRIIEKETTAGKTKKEVKETVRERFQPFEGVVIGIRGRAENQSFIVRRIGAGNIGIERIFPSVSPWISKIVVTRRGQVRRAKLNYLRGAKKDKLKSEAVKEEIVSKKVLKAESQKPSEEKSADANKEVQQDLKAEKPKEVKVDTKVEKKEEVKESPKAAK